MTKKASVGSNRARHLVWLAAAVFLCGGVAVGLSRSPDFQFELGYAYENGNFHGWHPGFARNDRQAAHWLGLAAQANHPRAQYMLGILYSHGWGVSRDSAQAVDWFSRSARNGYGPACYHLGWMYHKGDGVPRDDAAAQHLLEQAAAQGMAAAHLVLGRFYERGEGVPPDGGQALKWYALAIHFARSRPGAFDNAAFAGRAQAAYDALTSRTDASSEKQGQMLARRWLTERPL
ncbi:MAG: tetratricopeptide repeat protein [Thiobacillus sp.]